jgi:hypothetical protein
VPLVAAASRHCNVLFVKCLQAYEAMHRRKLRFMPYPL